MEPLAVFLEANVLFSAALGGEAFELIWALSEKGVLRLLTSPQAYLEAERNLALKRPEALPRLAERMRRVRFVPEPRDPAPILGLPPADARLYRAAEAAGATVFLTGDRRHFGPFMERGLAPRVRTPRDFLLELGREEA